MAAGSSTLGSIRGKIQIDYDGAGVARAIKDQDNLQKKGLSSQEAWKKTSIGLAATGGIIAAGFAVAVKSAADFEQGLSNIQAVSGATTGEMDKIRAKALQLGKDTQFSATEAANAMEELAKAGLSTTDILNGAADATVALAAAGEVSMPEAATIASNAMNQFGLTAQEMPRIADLIAGAANASAIDVSDFGQSLQQAGAVAHLAGLDFGDTAVAIAEMGNAGIKGSDAGTSLKTFLQNLIPTTKQQKELMDQLGITTKGAGNQFFDASGKVKSLADISQVLQNALKGMSKEQQLATLQTLFGSDAIRAAAVLADNGATGFNNMATAMSKVKAADVAKTKMDNLKGSIEQMKGSLETASIELGTALLPSIKSIVDAVTGLVNWFANLSPSTQRIIIDVLGAVAAFTLFSAGLIRVVKFAKDLAAVAKAIKLVAAATRIWQGVMALLNIEILGTPLGWIILILIAVAAAVLLVIKYHKQIASFFVSVWNQIFKVIKPIGEWFAGPFVGFFKSIFNWIKSNWPLLLAILAGPFGLVIAAVVKFRGQILNAITGVLRAIGGFFANLGKTIGSFFAALFGPIVTLVAPAFIAFFRFIEALFKLGVSIVTAIWAVMFTILGAILKVFINAAVSTWNLFWNGLKIAAQAFWNFIQPYVQIALNVIMGFLRAFANTATVVWDAVWFVMRAAAQAFVGFIQGVLNTVQAVWNAAWHAVETTTRAVWNVIGPFILGAVNGVVHTVQAALNVLRAVWTVAWNVIKAYVTQVANNITAVIRAFVNVIAGIFNGMTKIVNSFRHFFDQLHAAANGGTGTLISFLAGIPGRILKAFGNMGSLLYQKGRDLIQGIINGIRSMGGRISDALVGLLPGPLRRFAGMLGLASPSKLFRKWGIWTVQGLINGLSAMKSALASTMSDVAAATTAPVGVGVTTNVLGSAGLPGPSDRPPTPPPAPPGTPAIIIQPGAIKVDQAGNVTLDPKKIALAANEGNRQLRAFAGSGVAR